MKIRLLAALLLPAVACGLQLLLWDDWIKPYVWFLFFPAAFFGAWLGGLYGGLASTLIGAVLVWYVFIPPRFSFNLQDPASIFSVGIFILMGGGFAHVFERLKRSQAIARSGFDAAFEQAAVGMALVAPDGHWLRVNRKLCDIVGYSRAELMEMTFKDITHPDDLAPDLENVRRLLAGETDSFAMEKRYIHKSGQHLWINLTVGLACKRDGSPDYFVSVIEDISARIAARFSLADSQHRLQLLIDHAPAAMAMFDTQMRYLAVSRRWCNDYALGERQMIGLSHYEVFPEISEDWRAVHRRAMAGEVMSSDEDRFVRADGTEQWLRWEIRPWHGGDGCIGGIVIFSEDITQRKQAVDALRVNEAKLRDILDFSPDAVFIVDDTRRFRFHNRRAEQLLGYDAAELDEIGMLGAIPSDCREEMLERFQQSLSGEAQFFESRLLRKDGSQVEVEINGMRLPDGTVIAEIRDITERKAAETALRKLSKAVEQSPESIVITDLTGAIEYVNEACVAQTGYRREELLGKNPRVLHSGNTPHETYVSLWSTLKRGDVWKGEFINRRKDGSEFNEFAIITPIRDSGGSVTNYVAIKEDITEKKRIGEELSAYRFHLEQLVADRTVELERAREQAEGANLAKSAFLANMSHEIRTPMNAILGLTHLLRKDASTENDVVRLGKIDGAARHLLGVINDILDLSKIESGKLMLEIRDFSLTGLLEEVGGLVNEAAQAKGIAVSLDAGAQPVWLRGDVTRLRQALLNYAGNAVKFTERGTVVIRAEIIEAQPERCRVRFSVADSGIGIESEAMSRLFKSFEQADLSTTRKFGGTGLGLSITRHLARMMGGDAGADSCPGQGSTFWFTVLLERGEPVRTAAVVERRIASDGERLLADYRGTRVLLAEDNAINREVAIELLQEVGLEIDVACNGREALEMAGRNDYALVLMDVQMPEMDGRAATRAIRALPGRENLPILAMTANAFDEDRAACEAAGMSGFVAKPVDPPILFSTLLECLLRTRPSTAEMPVDVPVAEVAAPVSGIERTLARLEQEGGVNVARGLRLLHGKRERYVELVRLLLSNHGDAPTRIAEQLKSGQMEDALRLAHSVKGAAATMGAESVAEAAEALEDRLRTDREIALSDAEPLLAGLSEKIRALQASLD